MLMDATVFIIRVFNSLVVLVLLMRFYLYMIHASYKHPLTHLCIKLTDFAVKPLKKIIPSFKGYENADIVLSWLINLLGIFLLLKINSMPYDLLALQNWLLMASLACVGIIKYSINLLMGVVFLQAILSWTQPYNILTPILSPLTKPFLKFFSWARIRNIDLSTILLLIVLQLITSVFILNIENYFLAQLSLQIVN